MNVELMFDHQAIVEERRSSAFFAVIVSAPEVLPPRPRPCAFCLAIDLTPGIDNTAFCESISAAHLFIRHLRRDDHIAIITYGGHAEVLFPLGRPTDKPTLHALLDSLYPAHGSNLRAAKRVAARELRKAETREPRFIRVHDVVGCNPQEFVAQHLGGLQPLLVSEIRFRLDLLDFVDWAEPLGRHGELCFPVPDGRYEYILDDLLAGEERHACFQLHVTPLPKLDGDDNLTLAGEPILQLEIAYKSHQSTPAARHLIQKTVTAQATETFREE